MGTAWQKARRRELMFAELLGKEAGYCRGKGGSMHIADPATGNLGANAIVGGSVGIATGAAFSAKALKTERVAVCFFGEGALGQGVLYECFDLASSGNCLLSTFAKTICIRNIRIFPRLQPAISQLAQPHLEFGLRLWTDRTCAQCLRWRGSLQSGHVAVMGRHFWFVNVPLPGAPRRRYQS